LSTIAYFNGIIAGDTQLTVAGQCTFGVEKVGRTKNFLFGYAGSLAGMPRMYDWVRKMELAWEIEGWHFATPPENMGEMNATVMLVDRGGKVWILTEDGGLQQIHTDSYAIGSGEAYALGALHVGADAVDAVGAATRWDINSGGLILQASFSDAPFMPGKRG